MTKNKLVLHNIALDNFSALETEYDKIKALVSEIKAFFEREGFAVTYADDDTNQQATITIGTPDFNSVFNIYIKYGSSSSIYYVKGVLSSNGNLKTTQSSYKPTTSNLTCYLMYFTTNDFLTIDILIGSNASLSIGYNAYFLTKGENGKEYFKDGYSTALTCVDDLSRISIPAGLNTGNIDKAVITKIPAGLSYLKCVFSLRLSSLASSIDYSSSKGGLIAEFKGYGKFLIFSPGSQVWLFAVKLDEEEV